MTSSRIVAAVNGTHCHNWPVGRHLDMSELRGNSPSPFPLEKEFTLVFTNPSHNL